MKSIKFTKLFEFDQFEQALNISRYTPVASSWFLLIVDIRNSTEAVSQGRYKEINSVAGASVMAVLNAVGDTPFVFGGDGVTFLLAPEKADLAGHVLALTRDMAKTTFGFELAVGKVPVRDLYAAGFTLGAADLKLSEQQKQSMFSGSGIAEAERWIKCREHGHKYQVPQPTSPNPPADYSGLECRWNPLPAKKGVSLTLIASCPFEPHRAQQVYSSIMKNMDTLLGGEMPSPVRRESLKLGRRLGVLSAESRIRTFGSGFLSRWIYQILQFLITRGAALMWERFSSRFGRRYIDELIKQSDFRKFDGCLRMVLDVSEENADRITSMLEDLYRKGELAYGTHRSDHVLLTCMIQNRAKGKHFHLVDGGEGGYTQASRGLKERLLALQERLSRTA